MERARSLMEMTSPETAEALKKTNLAIIPIGSVEQHGKHLPMGTDYYAAEALARRTASLTGGLLVDFIPFGVTPLHMGFPGTISLRAETMIAVFMDVVGSVHHHGARNFVFYNWHERNLPVVEIAAERAQNELEGAKVLIVHAHFIAKDNYGQEVGLTHGGELEVLPVMADRPELVHLDLADDPSPQGHGVAQDRLRRDPAVYYIPKDVKTMYASGWYGNINDTSPERVDEVVEGTSRIAAERIKAYFEI
ncbi:MAG: creatininase family protein [Nitrospinaceae bacterium]|jgi:creatinine amidohydrolase|nr:creatininase family protein [Nitrospinaceae bacterium]MBT3432345.1 creatininase family protein [Nitrospinaceae bacterium]MBT3821453.1 creatininase family protein [Nitrospinaceae bacterium]MBT4092875.1 creatininase family protein [Nitrospinaceae bacterium]MBT4430837.1 creatininase family protein [Nitrospinaceae bacterium]